MNGRLHPLRKGCVKGELGARAGLTQDLDLAIGGFVEGVQGPAVGVNVAQGEFVASS